ncbi:4Fe-4S binding protein [Shimia sagamensis]|uniref:4Fe-4S dicluster domain-containing protein n=1 Tax=Shimia sagamensis TaxID=1566352 RepID=A0ABY1N960_9RHOB|nr:4Fe-4S binding protein [Shimia sagamensis]SMP03911.1 4Fe-4S dicluster domain-containing protein [Shimia sagamensis]
MSKTLILCNCSESMPLNTEALDSVDSVQCTKVHTELCGAQAQRAAELMQAAPDPENTCVACTQEQTFFSELADDLSLPEPTFVDLRNRAGWSDEAEAAGPKMAALLADGLREPPATKTFDITSEGLCLIVGPEEAALAAARQLTEFLSVTVLLSPGSDAPEDRDFDVIAGQLKKASGALGNFSVEIDALQQIDPSGRGALTFGEARNGAKTSCDILLDLRGETPLFPAPEKREGYLLTDPKSLPATHAAILEASHLVGTFEKPLYLSLEPSICAHSRASQTGCTKCLDICPTSAIRPAGDHIDIDPNICAGCGSCAALCPSGAITYDDPPVSALFARISGMAEAYRNAGGAAPRLLVHDRNFGAELIALAARYDRGLPAKVIPMDLERVSGFGHAEMLAALSSGFVGVDVLAAPTTDRGALDSELLLAQALSGDQDALRILAPEEPSALCDALYGASSGLEPTAPILPLGNRRQVTRLAVKALHGDLDAPLPLPENAPYGAVLVDKDACTLCLSCASLCPAGALGDNPDKPQLRFQEDACLQCGLCAHVCPENAISLVPQLNTSDAALSQQVVHEEEPFDCIECGTPFGVKSTIERIVEKLEGKHAMFATSDAARMIRMCDDCRVNAQFHQENNPFSGNERPQVRTSEDYFSKRRDH